MRPLAVVAALILPLVAGCISLPEDSDAATGQPSLPPAEDRIDGMTSEESAVDTVTPCDNGGGIQIPPGGYCATRVLTVTGRSGVATLPVDLSTVNGAVSIVAGTGDAWSFIAEIQVRALTEDAAREGLDTTWTWSHEESGKHHLRAAPVAAGPGAVDALGATLEGASYQVVLPAWTTLDVVIATTNGAVSVSDFRMDGIDVKTTNGAIAVVGDAPAATLVTENGAIDAALMPTASGRYAMKTTNGKITLGVPEDRSRGYDASAKTTNGNVEFELEDGETSETNAPASSTATFKTDGYESRAIQTQIEAETTNGSISVGPI